MKTEKKDERSCKSCQGACHVLAGTFKQDVDEASASKVPLAEDSGEVLFKPGSILDKVLCLTEGQVYARTLSKHGKPVVMHTYVPGEFVPFPHIMLSDVFKYELVTAGPVKGCWLTKEEFFKMLNENPEFKVKTNEAVLSYTQKIEEALCFHVHLSVEQRIAKVLLDYSKHYNNQFYLSRRDLAEISNATVETAIRTLTQFEKNDWIKKIGRKLQILNAAALQGLLD